jgi:multidrug resistance efflux pump
VIELMLGTYGVACWLLFFKFKIIPINLWTIVTAGLGAVVIIGSVLLTMNYCHPVTSAAQFYMFTTPITPQVRGRVIEVPVVADVPLKKGDVLFRIDPAPYQSRVTSIDAQLKLARIRLDQETKLVASGAGNQYEVDKWQSDVDRLTADLENAKFDLNETTVRAPADGSVTQLILRPGMMAVPLPLAPVMVFVHSDEPVFIAGFKQNAIQNIDPGDKAEVAFSSIPGRVFKAKVIKVFPAMAEGQLSPTGKLISIEKTDTGGRIPVAIEFEEDMTKYKLPAGTSAKVAVYTGKAHHFEIVRKIILRMKSWENYVFAP